MTLGAKIVIGALLASTAVNLFTPKRPDQTLVAGIAIAINLALVAALIFLH